MIPFRLLTQEIGMENQCTVEYVVKESIGGEKTEAEDKREC